MLIYSRYSKTNIHGLNTRQIQYIKDFKENMEDYWSNDKIEIDGIEYLIETEVLLKETIDWSTTLSKASDKSGFNFVSNWVTEAFGEIISDLGVGSTGKGIILSKGNKLKPRFDTGSHEAGHLLGLVDRKFEDNSIMGWNNPRNRPNEHDFNQVFKNANIQPVIGGRYVVRGKGGN